jgi:hypothetical protein
MNVELSNTDVNVGEEPSNLPATKPDGMMKWKLRLKEELSLRKLFDGWNQDQWRQKLKNASLLSDNYDTVVSLDWPHYCGGATEGCGGKNGWCYTLGGQLGGGVKRSKRAAMTDSLARNHPALFGEVVAAEIAKLVSARELPYPNLRFSGSGELHPSHLPALFQLRNRGINLWGFSRNIRLAIQLRRHGISVLFSCDITTPVSRIDDARNSGLRLAYTSTGVSDPPPDGTFVTFPLHRSGKVREIVSAGSVCPKVAQEYLEGKRTRAACQARCTRCHRSL